MSRKTIDINPALFTVGGNKTRKSRDKKDNLINRPLISPNILKNKLLKRIKDYKNKETHHLENNKKTLSEPNANEKEKRENGIQGIDKDTISYTDEFNDSIRYLQTLSKQKKIEEEKARYENNKQKRRDELERNTVKNYSSLNYSPSYNSPFVNIDLPEELKESFVSVSPSRPDNPMTLHIQHDHVPYGVLKGGLKPTYRTWNKTQRNNDVTNPQSALIVTSEREQRLNHLKEKIKQKQIEEEMANQQAQLASQKATEFAQKIHLPQSQGSSNFSLDMMSQPLIQKPLNDSLFVERETLAQEPVANGSLVNDSSIPTPNHTSGPSAFKRITKKTIKRKYTLGKSNIKKTVGVLLKDRATRKKIISAQKDLKQNSIHDIKSYLRNHNLIKIGSNAPNDVVRKLYESAMLSGEITNNNTETLIHNFLKDDKEL